MIPESDANAPPQLFWDGACGFCCWFVRWLRRRGGEESLRIVPYQEAPAEIATPEFREHAARAVQVITSEGDRLAGGRACLYALRKIGWRWTAPLAVPPLVWLVELGYRIVSRNRRFFARFVSENPKTCRGERR